ncbi:hypothetical protein GCM10025794_38240 [Massilia kyonggiensis]
MDTNKTTQTDRDPLFDALRAEVGRLDAPRGVEKELLQAFAKLHPPKRRWYHRLAVRPVALAGSLAAGALVLAFAAWSPPRCRVRAWPRWACRSRRKTRAIPSVPRCSSRPTASRWPCA